MCIALLGVMGMQYYFIKESFRQKSQLFDLSVNNALSEVIRQLGKRDASLFLRRKAEAEQRIKTKNRRQQEENAIKRRTEEFVARVKELNKKIDTDFRKRDSTLRSKFQRIIPIDEAFYTAYIKNPNNRDKVSIRVKLHQSVNYANGVVYQNEEHELYAEDSPDAIKKNLSKKPSQKSDSAYYLIENPISGFTVISIPRANSRIVKQIKKANLRLEAEQRAREATANDINTYVNGVKSSDKMMFFQDLANEYERYNQPLIDRVNVGLLDTLLSSELARHGLNLTFNYVVSSANTKEMLISKASNLDFDYTNAYSSALFPKEFNKDAGVLSVYFPYKNRYLTKNMSGVLFSSVGLLLVLMGCFAYTIFIIFRQKKISEMKTDFINNMTHEFKTPVATIMIASEALKDPDLIPDTSRVSRLAGIIYDENVRLGNHIERVLNVARLDRGELKLDFKTIEMNDLISAIAETMVLQFEKRGAMLDLQLNADRAIVNGDELHLSNVVFNLIDNALKYSKTSPEISIITSNTSKYFVLKVRDNGIGMSKDQISRIFEQFYRIPTGNIHDVKGFGLGLSYVNDVVKRHHGNIKVRSDKDKGSEFEINLPLS